MKLINYADTDWLIGDEAADLMLEYSVLMAREGTADSVDICVIAMDGTHQTVSILLGPATMMTARHVDSEAAEPDNSQVIEEVRARIHAILSPPSVLPSDPSESVSEYDF